MCSESIGLLCHKTVQDSDYKSLTMADGQLIYSVMAEGFGPEPGHEGCTSRPWATTQSALESDAVVHVILPHNDDDKPRFDQQPFEPAA